MPENLSLPEDLSVLSTDELTSFESTALARFDALEASATTEPVALAAELAEMETLASNVKRVRLEQTARTAQVAANVTKKAELAALRQELSTATEPVEPVTASAERPVGGATTEERAPRKLNLSLADVQRQAPQATVARKESVLVASADIPDFASGQKLNDSDMLVAAMQARARTAPITHKGDEAPRLPVASLLREHKYTLDPSATPAEINEVLTAAANPDILIAAGGWCSPSEISYDLFNIVCEDGMLDLPTVGINRGGIRWPTSPSFADVTSSQALFHWTETQDIAAVTGTAQSGVKTCGRVPCPGFNEARLACDGICLTVGNLTQDAYPETITNFMKLLQVANARKINRARIQTLQTFAGAVTGTFGAGGEGVVAPVLGALELQAIDYRERYSMCEGAVLEVVLPRWLRGPMRSDLRRRTGASTDQLSMTDAQLMRLFDAINIRIQWVSDYQVRTTGYPGVPSVIPTAWPTTVEFLMYAPGTVVLGQGMRLNLGVIRDSLMNQTNDFTAAWMEDCWLMFQPGHEVRRGVVNICPDGTTGAHDLTACGV